MSWKASARSVLDERGAPGWRRRALQGLAGRLARLVGEPFTTTWALLERAAPSLVAGARALPGELEAALLVLQRRREAFLTALRAFEVGRRAAKRRGRRVPAPGALQAMRAAHALPAPAPHPTSGGEEGNAHVATPRLLQVVRVVALREGERPFDGSEGAARPPAVGDLGTVVEVLRAPGLPPRFLVEAVAEDGVTTWLAEFDEVELALVSG